LNTLTAEERAALRESVHRLLRDECSESAVRATMETESGYDPDLWRSLSEMGVVGLVVDEAQGGSGVGPVELEAVMEEVGAALLCSPLLASGVVAAELLKALGDKGVSERLLPEIAAGTSIATAVLTGDSGCWTEEGVTITGEIQDGGWQLSGDGSYVLHGQNADVLLVVANTDEGLAAFVAASSAEGVSIEALPTFDHTLRLAGISFDGVEADRIEASGSVWEAVRRAMDLALVALAGEQAGGAQKVLDFTVEYAKTRIQFGRQIGSFQAIKHMAANLLLETESAISAARHAASRLAQDSENRAEAVSLAAFACADAFVKTAADGIQMHGGIAFTWEHPAHLYLKRARADAQLFGTPAYHRERYLQELGA
jgi:alkylation response protein AidB-like acyl-CoA dehydrogenase|tara:strand:- start:449 stop:1561 length:1113 start_codon:yes stop_codon:yes gene_type:complete